MEETEAEMQHEFMTQAEMEAGESRIHSYFLWFQNSFYDMKACNLLILI